MYYLYSKIERSSAYRCEVYPEEEEENRENIYGRGTRKDKKDEERIKFRGKNNDK